MAVSGYILCTHSGLRATYQWTTQITFQSEGILLCRVFTEQRSGCSALAQRAPVYQANRPLLPRPIEALGTALNMKCGVGCRSMSLAPPSNVKEVELRSLPEFGSLIEVEVFKLQNFRRTCYISAPGKPICKKFGTLFI